MSLLCYQLLFSFKSFDDYFNPISSPPFLAAVAYSIPRFNLKHQNHTVLLYQWLSNNFNPFSSFPIRPTRTPILVRFTKFQGPLRAETAVPPLRYHRPGTETG